MLATDIFFAGHPDPMWIYDAETLAFLEVNEAAIAAYGYSREEFLRQRITDIRDPEEADVLQAYLAGRRSRPAPSFHNGGVWRHRRKSGDLLHASVIAKRLDYEGRPAVLVTARDVSRLVALEAENRELAQRERRLREAAEASALQFGLLFQSVPGNFLAVSAEHFRIVAASEGMLRLMGLSREEAIGRALFDLLPEIDGAHAREVIHAMQASFGRAAERRQPDIMAVYSYPGLVVGQKTQVAQRLWHQVNTPAFLPDGRLGYFIASVNDVTDFIRGTARGAGEGEADEAASRFDPYQYEAVRHSLELKAANIRLQEQETNLRIAQRLLKIGFWKYDTVRKKLIWSQSLYDIAGIDPARFDGSLAAYLGHLSPSDQATAEASVMLLDREDQPLHQFERRVIRPDGRVVHVKGIGERTRTVAGEMVVGVAQDVTEERERESQLRLLSAAVEGLNDIVMIFRSGTDSEGRVLPLVYVNSAFDRQTGHPRDVLQGRPLEYFLDRLRPPVPFAEIEGSMIAGRPVRRQVSVQLGNNQTGYFSAEILPVPDEQGHVGHWVAVVRDITERRNAERRAAINEDRFQLASRATEDVVWEWDLRADRLTWNEAFAQLTGDLSAPAETSFEAWERRVHPDDRARVLATLNQVAHSADLDSWSEEYRFMRDDGSERIVLDRGFVMRDDTGAGTRMVGSIIDLTERRAAEQRLREMERLEAIGRLTGGVAHDFNNLLTIILGNSEALHARLDEPKLKRMAELIQLAASRGADLTSRLLAFARRQPLQPQALCLKDRIIAVRALLKGAFDARIVIGLDLPETLWRTRIDPGQFDVALLNLAFNARDAMPEGGIITIAASNLRVRGKAAAEREGVPAGDYVLVTLTDNGVGMSDAVQSQAFEPFFTTKPAGKGSGLGLSMVYGFVRQSEGNAQIRSRPGEGTTIRLLFPRSDAKAAAPAPEASVAEVPSGPSRRARVLIVEDDLMVQEFAAQMLEELGCDVRLVASAEAALPILESGEAIDLLFTDIVLGAGMNGISLADMAGRLRPGLKVLYTSGYVPHEGGGRPDLPEDAILLAKPYDRGELVRKLEAALNRQV